MAAVATRLPLVEVRWLSLTKLVGCGRTWITSVVKVNCYIIIQAEIPLIAGQVSVNALPYQWLSSVSSHHHYRGSSYEHLLTVLTENIVVNCSNLNIAPVFPLLISGVTNGIVNGTNGKNVQRISIPPTIRVNDWNLIDPPVRRTYVWLDVEWLHRALWYAIWMVPVQQPISF